MNNRCSCKESRHSCSVQNSDKFTSFSLMDYKNGYFRSNKLEKIIEFYNSFENRSQLIEWMRELPKGSTKIHEIGGDGDIVVVIPTANFNGKYAKECVNNIFKGLHMIFIESGEPPDPYFNYAHNVNLGLQLALENKPKWVIISNDDMFKIDDISNLSKLLNEINNESHIILARKNGSYSSYYSFVSSLNVIGKFLKVISWIVPLKSHTFSISSLYFLKKFDIRIIGISKNEKKLKRIITNKNMKIMNINNFSIFGYEFFKQYDSKLFDENFINGYEDIDLTINLLEKGNQINFVDYKIGDYSGKSLGTSLDRSAREIANLAYFNSKHPNLEKAIEKSEKMID